MHNPRAGAVQQELNDVGREHDYPWIDEEDARDAMREAYAYGLDTDVVLSCMGATLENPLESDIAHDFRHRSAENPFRILSIDDDQAIVDSLKRLLEKSGPYAVRGAFHPGEVEALVHGWKPDLIICDVDMPEMTGPEMIAFVRGFEETRRTPVIMLTGLLEREVAKAVVHEGLLVMGKPIMTKSLIHCIRKQLAGTSAMLAR